MSHKPFQLELFPGSSPDSTSRSRSSFIFSNLTLSVENTIILLIVFVMSMVLSFSLGVERGKKVVGIQDKAVETTQRQKSNAPRKLILPGKRMPIEKEPTFTELSSVPVSGSRAAEPQGTIAKAEAKAVPHMVVPGLNPAQHSAYTIQVASYKQPKYAHKEAETLKRIGHEIIVMPKGNHSIVCVGRFGTKIEAQKVLGKIKNKYKDCLVRRL